MKEQCVRCKNFKECTYCDMGTKLTNGIKFMYSLITNNTSPFDVQVGCRGFEQNEEEVAKASNDGGESNE